MYPTTIHYIILFSLLCSNIGGLWAQDSLILDFYVDNQATSLSPNGTEQNPFSELSDALDTLQNTSSSLIQANIHIASSSKVYNVNKPMYTFDNSIISTLNVLNWINPDIDQIETSLPVLSLSNTSLVFKEIALCTIKDIEIILESDSIIVENTSLTLQNLNIQALASNNQSMITIQDGTNMIFEDLQIYRNTSATLIEYKTGTSSSSPKISLSNISINALEGIYSELPSPLFTFTADVEDPIGDLIVIGLQISTEKGNSTDFPRVLMTTGFSSVSLYNTSIFNETFYLNDSQPSIILQNIKNAEIDTVTFSESIITLNSARVLISLVDIVNLTVKDLEFSYNNMTTNGQSTLNFFKLSNIETMTISNQSINNCSFLSNFIFYKINNHTEDGDYFQSINLTIDGVTISQNTAYQDNVSFTYLSLQEVNLEDLSISNIEYSKNNFVSQVFSIQPSLPNSRQAFDPSFSPKLFKLLNISILDNNQTTTMTYLSFSPLYDQQEIYGCLQPIEAFALLFDNLTILNNSFNKVAKNIPITYQGNLFQIKQAQVHLNNSRIYQNNLLKYDLFTLGPKTVTIIITWTQFIENSLSLSHLVMDSSTPGFVCSYIENRPVESQTPLYRYSFILNSTFTGNVFELSTAFDLTNGFVALHDNNFTDEVLMDSQYITVSSLPPRNMLDQANYSRSAIAEDIALKNNPAAELLFHETTTKLTSHKSDNIYFLSIYMNNFTNLTAYSPTVLSITGFNIDQHFINIEENKFLLINSSLIETPSFVYINSIKAVRIVNNYFEKITGESVLFDLSQSHRSSLLIVNTNTIYNVTISSFLTCTTGEIGVFEFSNNLIQLSQMHSSLIYVNAKLSSSDWTVNKNTVLETDLDIDASKNQMIGSSFISLIIDTTSNNNQMLISNNFFDVVSMFQHNQEGLSFTTNLFTIHTSHAINFINLTASQIVFMNPGSFIQSTKSSSFSIKDSRLDTIQGFSSVGIIDVSTLDMLVSNCSISNYWFDNVYGIFRLGSINNTVKFKVTDSNFSNITGPILKINDPYSDSIFVSESQMNIEDSTKIELQLEMSSCSFSSIDSIATLDSIECKECILKNAVFSTFDQILKFESGAKGTFRLEDLKIYTLEDSDFLSNPFLEVIDSNMSLIIKNATVLGKNRNFYLIELNSGILLINNSFFSNITLSNNPLIMIMDQGQGIISNKINRTNPSITVQNTKFINFNSTQQVSMFSPTQLTWPSNRFNENSNKPISVITTLLPADIIVRDSVFKNFHYVSAVHFEVAVELRYDELTSTIKLENSVFNNIKFMTGPALTVIPKVQGFVTFEVNVSIEDSIFEENQSDLGYALCIFNSSLSISGSQFLNNYAKRDTSLKTQRPGAIFLGGKSEINHTITNTTFKNTIDPANIDIVYEPTKFNLSFISDGLENIGFKFYKFGDSYNVFLNNVSSLDLDKAYLRIDFLDDYGNLAYDLSSSITGTFQVGISSYNRLSANSVFEASDSNDTSLNISMSDLNIVGMANGAVEFLLYYKSDRFNEIIAFHATFRPCLPGEHNNSLICVPCPSNTYSFEPTQPCVVCPSNANCPGKSKICPKPGFWNSRANSTVLHECYSGRCPNDQDCVTCAQGYASPLCNGCDFNNSYVESGYLKCGSCQDPNMSLVFTILIGFAYFLYQIFSIYVLYYSIRKAVEPGVEFLSKRMIERSYYINSFLTYTQLISILYLNNYDLYKNFGLALQLGNPSTLIVYGTQCSMIALGIPSSEFLYYQTLFQVVYPIIQFLLISLAVLVLKLIRRRTNYVEIIVITALYLILSNQPGIVNNLGLFLSCSDLSDLEYRFITAHPNWSCETSQYSAFSHFFVIPNLVIWSGVIPVVLLIILFINRRRFAEENIRSPLGILTLGLRKEYYFWGIILIALKLSLSYLVFSLQQKSQIQVFLTLVLLWIYQSLVRNLKPYKNRSFNNFEVFLMNLLMFNIIVTQYLLDVSNGMEISEISIAVSIFANISFVLFVSWKILSLTYLRILSFIEANLMKRNVERTPVLTNEISYTSFRDGGEEEEEEEEEKKRKEILN